MFSVLSWDEGMKNIVKISPVDKTIQSLDFHRDIAILHAAG